MIKGARARVVGDAKPRDGDLRVRKTSRATLSQRKRKQIIEAATKIFLEHGYHGASMDAVTAAAGVSKPTLYSLVGNKEELFEQILRSAADEILLPTKQSLKSVKTIEAALYEFAKRYAEVLLSKEMLAVHRLGVGEAQRFPHLGKLFYNAGPAKALEGVTSYLAAFAQLGELDISDPEMAAHHFYGLTINPPRNHMLFFGHDSLTGKQIDDFIRKGLAIFLKAYGKV